MSKGWRVGIARRIGRAVRAPALGVFVLAPVVLSAAVAATPERRAVAVIPSPQQPPAAVVSPVPAPPRGLHIPAPALAAYRKAEAVMAASDPGCGMSWNLLAGVGRLGGTAGRPTLASARSVRADGLGPMKMLAGTWTKFASDGDGDGKSEPQNLFDASLATARYLCSGGLNLSNEADAVRALLSYNNSMAYAENVIGWAAAYASGVAPINLPPISGSVPQLPIGYVPGGQFSSEPAVQFAPITGTQNTGMQAAQAPSGPSQTYEEVPPPIEFGPTHSSPPPLVASPESRGRWVTPSPDEPAFEPDIAPPVVRQQAGGQAGLADTDPGVPTSGAHGGSADSSTPGDSRRSKSGR